MVGGLCSCSYHFCQHDSCCGCCCPKALPRVLFPQQQTHQCFLLLLLMLSNMLTLCLVTQDKTNKVKDDDLLLEEEVEQQPSPEQAQQKAVEGMHHLTESHGPAAELPRRPILGVHDDLSGAALVRRAIEGGQGAGEDWTEFKYRHRQAELDSQLLYATLQQAEQFHQVRWESIVLSLYHYNVLLQVLDELTIIRKVLLMTYCNINTTKVCCCHVMYYCCKTYMPALIRMVLRCDAIAPPMICCRGRRMRCNKLLKVMQCIVRQSMLIFTTFLYLILLRLQQRNGQQLHCKTKQWQEHQVCRRCSVQ